MYLPRHFEQHDRAALAALMRERPLATLVVATPSGPSADLIPLEYVADAGPQGTLRGHVARANPLWQHAGAQALVVFTGPEAYVSPGWYAAKREHGKVVPTWNYTMVQARGILRAVDDAAWLRALVGRLTDHHEAAQATPWQVGDAPDEFVAQMLRAIVGIEITLDTLQGKWKISQNRSVADRDEVAAGLDATQPEMAALVRLAKAAGPA
jgi:transcriptional regulator